LFTKLIETKLHPPKKPVNLLRRERLINILDSSLRQEGVSILVSAPAGYGKTSLAVDWLTHASASSAWLTLDKHDNDLSRFIQYVYAAVGRATKIEESSALALVKAPGHPPEEELALAVANDFSTLNSKTVLILDDYHRIKNMSIHGIVSHLLQYSPPFLVVVILTREDPSFPLSRLRTQDKILELRAKQLQFSMNETKTFLESNGVILLSDRESHEFTQRTEGWAAGLKLALLSLEQLNERDSRRLVSDFSGSNRYVFDYFGEEVLQHQSRRITEFLSDTAHLAKLRADLCNVVTGRTDSERILAELVHKNLFIAPVEGEEGWYRYHPLFAGFLNIRLNRGKTAELQRKTADWYTERKMYYEAMGHAEQIGDERMLSKVILEAALPLLEAGRYENLLTWLGLLSEKNVLADSRLTAYKGWALYFQNHIDEAFDLIHLAASKNPSIRGGELLILKAWLQSALGKEPGLKDLDGYLNLKNKTAPFFLLHAHFLRCKLSLRSGDPKSALASAETSVQLAQEYGNMFFLACAAHLEAYCKIELGDRFQAELICDRMISRLREDKEQGEVFAGILRIPAAFCRYLANDIAGAEQKLHEAKGDVNSRLLVDYTIDDGSVIAALVSLSAGDQEKAVSDGFVKYPALRWLFLSAEAIKNNNLDKAATALRAVEHDAVSEKASLMNLTLIVNFRLLLLLNRISDIETIIQNLEPLARRNKAAGGLIILYVFMSLVKYRMGDVSGAQTYMRTALESAETGEYRRPFLDERKNVEIILRGMEAEPNSFASSLLNDFGNPKRRETELMFHEKISKRECEVISSMAKGMSNQEIADALFISVGTVKWHVNNIFGKLDVKNRTSAINRAKELNLIPD